MSEFKCVDSIPIKKYYKRRKKSCKNVRCFDGEICKKGKCVDPCQDVLCEFGECVNGECVIPTEPLCNADPPLICTSDETCVDGECVPGCSPPFINCGPSERCLDGICVDACQDIICQLGVCINGDCVLPTEPLCNINPPLICTALETCVNGECVRGCSGPFINCGPSEQCLNGICVDRCTPNIGCPSGQTCSNGFCIPSCISTTCLSGLTCMDGKCVEPCNGNTCELLQECINGIYLYISHYIRQQ